MHIAFNLPLAVLMDTIQENKQLYQRSTLRTC